MEGLTDGSMDGDRAGRTEGEDERSIVGPVLGAALALLGRPVVVISVRITGADESLMVGARLKATLGVVEGADDGGILLYVTILGGIIMTFWPSPGLGMTMMSSNG